MAWYDRILGKKEAQLAFINRWQQVVWPSVSFNRLAVEGYRQNSAVFQCVSALVFGYQQPRPVVVRDGEPVDRHPLQALLNRPNALMSWQELACFIATYKAIGGQCYLHKIRNRAGQVLELWPYHAGQLAPIPGPLSWIEAYEYDDGAGNKLRVDRDDVVHLKWPAIDLEHPWLALAPLMAVAREVDTDSEATRYIYALLKNDATPQTIINVKATMTDIAFEHFQQTWMQRHGGDNRGGIGLLEGDASVHRVSLNLQEMAFDALRRVPEARIAGAFKVPPEYVGLNVGLEHSTYSNKQEARRGFIEDTIMQLTTLDAGELTADLAAEFPGNVQIDYDYSKVVGLQENENDKYTRALTAWKEGVVTRNEARKLINLPPVEDLRPAPSAPPLPPGDAFKDSAPPSLPDPNVIDGEVVRTPPQLTDDAALDEEAAKALRRAAFKAIRSTSVERTEEQLRRDVLEYLERERRKVEAGEA